ncbi:leucine-rich repeat extensin-like protein 3 [Quillaja saponaria]|uniref:Leucine-rich repeat extensin-like protein 3 n=1 Tax=Quillaja saponaria TaxID=32244 RepID=A0AAD7LUD6_QUISA|nr:leucine-rich repeat extensin-like protein 3 [Quillaja saponaria]
MFPPKYVFFIALWLSVSNFDLKASGDASGDGMTTPACVINCTTNCGNPCHPPPTVPGYDPSYGAPPPPPPPSFPSGYPIYGAPPPPSPHQPGQGQAACPPPGGVQCCGGGTYGPPTPSLLTIPSKSLHICALWRKFCLITCTNFCFCSYANFFLFVSFLMNLLVVIT